MSIGVLDRCAQWFLNVVEDAVLQECIDANERTYDVVWRELRGRARRGVLVFVGSGV